MTATIVFDLDGTLADTSGDLLAAANACFADLGHPRRLGPQDAAVALRGGRAMLRAGGLDEATVDAQYPRLLAHYEAALDVHTRLFPGAMEAVEALVASGRRVAICTNKPETLARRLLASLGVLDAFAALVGSDTLPMRKPDPETLRETVRRAGGDPARAALVGDTVTDHDTARGAGVPSILVGFGPSGATTAALGPDALIAHFDELPGAVARLGL